ncbi:MAG: tRNA 2-thiocytidine biosynthesis protein TtcA [Chlamydiales bacterium]|nr:tRNA 2-thiocytidine biosynthesis protein TtcA [Chlamydiales bacterium]
MFRMIKPPKHLESLCRKALNEFNLLESVDHLGLALSGGKDSLTLLFLLHAINGCGFAPFKMTAFHVQGAFSCGPSVTGNYLKNLCNSLDVELVICTSEQKREKLECYSCSRERRKLIFEAAKKHGATSIAFGHHRDDSLQTLLMNTLHKGEFAANLPKVPMHHYGITIIRPLIHISEQEIFAFAKENGFARITCQCPVGQNSKRKAAEHLLSQMEAIFPNARSNLSRLSLELGSDKAMRP